MTVLPSSKATPEWEKTKQCEHGGGGGGGAVGNPTFHVGTCVEAYLRGEACWVHFMLKVIIKILCVSLRN